MKAPIVTDNSFDQDVIRSESPVLVYCWAQSREMCRPMSQVVNAVAVEKGEQLKTVLLDVDANPRIAQLYDIAMVPTLILFISGREQQPRIEGLTNKAHLSSTIEMLISAAQTASLAEVEMDLGQIG